MDGRSNAAFNEVGRHVLAGHGEEIALLVEGEPAGDISTLRNPESIEPLTRVIDDWRARQRIREEQRILERGRYSHVHYHAVALAGHEDSRIALVTIRNPPVNALNERALDELVTVVEHLGRRADVVAVIFTGEGTSSFVAGADIRQLLEDVHTLEEALTLPNVAHLAFRSIGWREGLAAGLQHEATLFARAVVDPDGGKAGIRAFFDRRSQPLPRFQFGQGVV